MRRASKSFGAAGGTNGGARSQFAADRVTWLYDDPVWSAAYSMNLFIPTHVTIGADAEPARDALFRLVEQARVAIDLEAGLRAVQRFVRSQPVSSWR